jgi:chromosomal replication initiator protein
LDGELKLHPDYTFANFVVGPCNRLAHASCVAVSRSPGTTYNPLFLYGSSGLGKTHLLHAVCHDTKQHYSKMFIQLLSCEEFVNRFISAIEQGNLAGFQKQFRSVDMLVIDDVQFLREREQSQEELFHTFNTLYQSGRQIILSADCAPSEIPSLEDRLISRFTWGLVTRIDQPSHDTKVAIATTTGQPITLELAKNALEGESESERHINITDIIEAVTNYYGVRLADLQSEKRSQSITLPRQVCMYLARNLTRHSLEEIGGHLGGRDHTTVMHSFEKIDGMRKKDAKFKSLLSTLEKQITQPAKK